MFAAYPLPTTALRPYSAGDLCRAMQSAAAHRGAVDASGLDRVLCHDRERGLLEVQAGAAWQALEVLVGPDFLPGTVGESVAANCAGPDGRPIVAHLRALTLATADGELRRASRERASELFGLAVGGFGAFGSFYSLTFDLGSLAQAAAGVSAPVRTALPAMRDAGPRWSVELLLPPEGSDAALSRVRALLEEHRCDGIALEARGVRPENETFLRWARREYVAVRVDFRTRVTLGASVGAVQLRARLIDLAIAAGGSFAPGALPFASRAQAEAAYPMLGAFFAEKRRLDPAERVLTPWYRGTRRAWRCEPCTVRWAKA
jgi:FAD/FMN-containing dehydrogenase